MTNKKTISLEQRQRLKKFLISEGLTPDVVSNFLQPFQLRDSYDRMMRTLRSRASGDSSEPVKDPVPFLDLTVLSSLKAKGRGLGKKAKKVVTTVQIDSDQLDQLKFLAERDDRTVSSVIRLAIRQYLEGK